MTGTALKGRFTRSALALPALAGLLALAACGGSSGAAAPGAASPTIGTQQGRITPGGNAQGRGVDGLVAAVDASTAQVQSASAQTAVTWNGATTFTTAAAGSLADVSVGSCVAVRSATPGSTAAPTQALTPHEVAATSVTVSQPVDGSCSPAGFGGGAGGGPGVRPGGAADGVRPSGAPGENRTRPSGAPAGAGGFGGGAFGGAAFGKVTSVSGDTFVVADATARAGSSTASPAATANTTLTTSTTVTTSGTTTYTAERTGTAADVKVGVCVTARGAVDSIGAVTATSIAVRPATNGACATGRRGAPGA